MIQIIKPIEETINEDYSKWMLELAREIIAERKNGFMYAIV